MHRAKNRAHPLMTHYGVDAILFSHPMLDTWRENFKGVEFHHSKTNFLFCGAVDDLWVNPAGELIVVDYKATSKDSEVNLDAQWQRGYKNQMEIYQWLFKQNGFAVSPTGYFVYCNGKRDREAFDAKLEFDIKLIPYTGDTAWVEGALIAARQCLEGSLPKASSTCDYCAYRQAAASVEGQPQSAPLAVTAKPATQIKRKKNATAAGPALF